MSHPVWNAPAVILAPMSGVTDLPFRRLAARLGAPVTVSEMVACADLVRQRRDVVRRAALDPDGPGAGPRVVQLAGREARWMSEAARIAIDAGAQVIDINMGCPARQVTGGFSGAALMRDCAHAATLIEAVTAAADAPVTLKMRLGWDDASRNAPHLARIAEDLGVSAITVHGRTRNQFYQGAADWTAVGETVRATRLPVIVNGDIASPDDARRALAASGAAGVMVGRGALGRPWVLGEIAAAVFGGSARPAPRGADLCDEIIRYLEDSLAFYGVALGVRMARKHLAAFVDAAPLALEPAARRVRRADLCRLETAPEIVAAVRALFCADDLAVAA